MANSHNEQIIIDGDRNVVVKCTGILDTSNQSLITVVDVTTLVPQPTMVRIDYIDYSISDQLEVQLLWDATTDDVIMPLAGRGRMGFCEFGGIQNPQSAGFNGNILLQTTGWASGTQIYTVILELVKQGVTS